MLQDSLDLLTGRAGWFLDLFVEHMTISLIAIFFSTLIGLFLGILISEKQGAAKVTLSIVNIFYTIPSLALLGLLIPFTGAGTLTAVIALTLYGLLPMVKNTHTGITNIDPVLIEAAEGMGSTRFQLLFRVKLPLALPVIMSGFRNMVTMTISLTTIAAYIGAGGLGTAIFRGISNNNMAMVLVASVITAVVAVVIDLVLGAVEKRLNRTGKRGNTKRTVVVVVVVVAILAAFVGVSQYMQYREEQNTIRVTSKSFTEQTIMGEMLEELIEANTDLEVEYTSVNSGPTANTGLVSGDYDCYVEYTGTAWSTYFEQDTIYHDDMFEELEAFYAEEDITWVNELGFNNTYCIAVTPELAEKYDLETYSDITEVCGELTLGAESEFYEHEQDGFTPMCEMYGMEWGKTVDIDQGLKYTAIDNGEIDAVIAYATDGALQESGLVVLEDDLGFFPSYMAGVVARDDLLEEHPELEDLFMQLDGTLDDEAMSELNNRVDSKGEDPADVAHDYLASLGLVDEE